MAPKPLKEDALDHSSGRPQLVIVKYQHLWKKVECMGLGKKTKELIVLVEAANGGADCTKPRTVTKNCNMGPCDRDCVLFPINSRKAWDEYEDCSTTCGEGTKTATR